MAQQLQARRGTCKPQQFHVKNVPERLLRAVFRRREERPSDFCISVLYWRNSLQRSSRFIGSIPLTYTTATGVQSCSCYSSISLHDLLIAAWLLDELLCCRSLVPWIVSEQRRQQQQDQEEQALTLLYDDMGLFAVLSLWLEQGTNNNTSYGQPHSCVRRIS